MKEKRRGYPISKSFGAKAAASSESPQDEGLTFREMRRQFIACPEGLHRATYKKLLREHRRILTLLEHLPYRRTWPVVRKRLRTELQNRLYRIRRRLGLRVTGAPPRQWYRTSAAAAFVGVSGKTLLRWTAQGRIDCERSPWGKRQRHYRRRDLIRLIKELRR